MLHNRGLVNASQQLVRDHKVPYSASIGAWYHDNHHEWSRLSIENGGSQLIRECRDPTRVASRKNAESCPVVEIQHDVGILFHDEFKKDLAALEAGGTQTLTPSDPLRSRVVTFLAENYTSKEAGRVMCPACLFETPHGLTICLNCRGTLLSYGERTQTEDEQQLQRADGGSDDLPGDDGQQQDEDVDVDQEEVDELIRKAKATARHQQAEHDCMRSTSIQIARMTAWTPVTIRMMIDQAKANPFPMWAIRLVPGCIIECTTDGAARVIDVVIITHLKASCKSVYSFMVDMDTTEYKERVINQGTIPEFDSYHPYLGRDKHGELKPPREEDMKALFEKKKSRVQ